MGRWSINEYFYKLINIFFFYLSTKSIFKKNFHTYFETNYFKKFLYLIILDFKNKRKEVAYV